MRWTSVASCVDDSAEHQNSEARLERTERRQQAYCINRLHINLERFTRNRFRRDLGRFLRSMFAPATGNPGIARRWQLTWSRDFWTRVTLLKSRIGRSNNFLSSHFRTF